MAELRETSIEHVYGDGLATIYSGECKWINLLNRLAEEYPADVAISHINDDGSLIVRLPIDWVKIKPKKKVVLTDEQIAASKARLEQGRLKRLANLRSETNG